MTATDAEQKHWEKGQEIADGFEAIALEVGGVVAEANPGTVGHPLSRRLSKQISDLRDFLAASHLPGENADQEALQ